MRHVLIVDDEIEMLTSIQKILEYSGNYEITAETDPKKAISLIAENEYDIVISDLKMGAYSGMDVLSAVQALNNQPQVIIVSGYGTIEAGVDAMREGAFDFIEKPFTAKKLLESLNRAEANLGEMQRDADSEGSNDFEGIIFQSDVMSNIIKMVKRIAPGNMNVLITGESGTGKELIARAIHRLSHRFQNPFVPVNCGALPEHLFESELFGHEKGAFTGAVKTKPGLLEFADRGTFFFDEIGDLSLTLQVKLLRMLEERKIRRVGSTNEIKIDVRIIAATNKNLEEAVSNNSFREDLYYRLNTIHIEIPPLRDRPEDIQILARHFLKNLCEKNDRVDRTFSKKAEESLMQYSWPGNVRELQNIIERVYFLSATREILDEDLPISKGGSKYSIQKHILNNGYREAKDAVIDQFEQEYLTHHLRIFEGNISKMAQSCGLDRRSVHRLIKKYNIIYQK